jgi:hypothetical protein
MVFNELEIAMEASKTAKCRVVLHTSQGELAMLRDVVLRAHGMCGGRYVQSDTEMRRRTFDLLDAAVDASPVMRGFLGRGGPEAHRDILGGTGSISDSC